MSGRRQHPSEATSRAVERSAGELATLASQRMEEHLRWYRDLSAEERSVLREAAVIMDKLASG